MAERNSLAECSRKISIVSDGQQIDSRIYRGKHKGSTEPHSLTERVTFFAAGLRHRIKTHY